MANKIDGAVKDSSFTRKKKKAKQIKLGGGAGQAQKALKGRDAQLKRQMKELGI